MTYLGHNIDADGLHPVPDRVTAIQEAQTPKSVSQLRSFSVINESHYAACARAEKGVYCVLSTCLRPCTGPPDYEINYSSVWITLDAVLGV